MTADSVATALSAMSVSETWLLRTGLITMGASVLLAFVAALLVSPRNFPSNRRMP